MPRSICPSLRRHKPSAQGVVTLSGKDIYLGNWPADRRKPPPEVQTRYNALVAEWLAGDRRLSDNAEPLTVSQLIVLFWGHVETHYRAPDGQPTSEVQEYRMSLRPLRHLYEDLPAGQFSPVKLKAVRHLMVEGYTHPQYGEQGPLSRKVINKRVSRIVSTFRWAVAEELIEPSVLHGLKAVVGLQRGRTEAKDHDPVTPVAETVVEATLPHLLPPVAAMVRLQQLTGMRSGEACILRACDLDMSGPVWLYRPSHHKTAHKGKARVIALGPKAQEVIKPFLRLDTQAFLFSPQDAVAERIAAGLAARKTPLSRGNRAGTNRRKKPRRSPGCRYTNESYRRAVARGIEKADAVARKKAVEEAKIEGKEPPAEDTVFVPHWHPHQLRHSHATEVRRKHGLEAAQAVLGHASADITQLYAERDIALAVRVAAEIG